MATSLKIKASLFATCLVDQLFPEVGVSTVRLLRRLGVEVDFPKDQTCCGQPVFNSGFRKEGELLARRVVRSFQGNVAAENHYVVVPSGSCAAMIKIFYPDLLKYDPDLLKQAQELSGRVYELSEFLVKVLGMEDIGAGFQGKVTYHPSCHLMRELGVVQEPRTLLHAVTGTELVEMDQAEVCCGFGGTFSVKYPDISGAMLDDKVASVMRTGAKTLVSCDMSCLMHIGGALSKRETGVRPMHLAQLLDGDHGP